MAHEKKIETSQAEPPQASGGLQTSGMLYPLTRLREDVDRMFDDFFSGRRWPLGRAAEDWGRLPSHFAVAGRGLIDVKLDISETPEAIEIAAEMPGVGEEDVEIELSGSVLTIKGEKTQQSEDKEKDYYRCERSYGSFQRSFGVPDSIDGDGIEAKFDKGVLHIVMPKKPEAKTEAKKIPVGGT